MVHGMIFVIRSSTYHVKNVLLVLYMHRSYFEKKKFRLQGCLDDKW